MNQNQIIRQLCQLNDKVNSLAENGINSQMPIENPLFHQQITDLSTKLDTANVDILKLKTANVNLEKVIKNTHKENQDKFQKMNGVVLKLEQNTKNIENSYLKVTTDYEAMRKENIALLEKMNGFVLKSPP